MTGRRLAQYRKERKWTQMQTARALGVSQTYLSLLESGKRPLTESLKKKAVKFFDLSPTEMPGRVASGEVPHTTDAELAADLADLGYVGFGHLRRKRPRRKNPADVLLSALNAPQREARAVEALPWLLLAYPDMNWNDVVGFAKMHDLQNRLGFLVNVAGGIADKRKDRRLSDLLHQREADLERSILAREDTLCNAKMTNAERRWLDSNRSGEAKHWRILTSMTPQLVRYAR